jgi:hypothetical protein
MIPGGRIVAMDWFPQLKECLAPYYPAGQDDEIVGYLKGGGDPFVWSQMLNTGRKRPQMIVLGSLPPTREQWIAAGVEHRGAAVTILLGNMVGWGVVYEGFMLRPWGGLVPLSDPRFSQYSGQLESWRRNDRPNWRPQG